jgi:hypothetical protein
VTIEISRQKSEYIYRQNPYNRRIIDVRKNTHGARWKPYQSFDSEYEARQELLKIESERQ